MRTDVSEIKSRQKATAENMTQAQRVQHQLHSGPVKSELRTVQEAIQIASAFNRQAKEAMKDRKKLEHARDFSLVLAYLTPDLSALFTAKFVPGEETKLYKELSSGCCIMAGLIFGIRDPEHKNDWLLGVKPFLTTPLVLSALKQRIDSEVIGIN
ncbi:MAG TPA: hypothetical protein VI386_31970 [Candidatus Sulfotelmatobacter sp.]